MLSWHIEDTFEICASYKWWCSQRSVSLSQPVCCSVYLTCQQLLKHPVWTDLTCTQTVNISNFTYRVNGNQYKMLFCHQNPLKHCSVLQVVAVQIHYKPLWNTVFDKFLVIWPSFKIQQILHMSFCLCAKKEKKKHCVMYVFIWI